MSENKTTLTPDELREGRELYEQCVITRGEWQELFDEHDVSRCDNGVCGDCDAVYSAASDTEQADEACGDWISEYGSALFAMAARAGRVDAIVAEHDRMCTGDNDCDLGDKVLRIYERDRAEQREDAKGGE